MTKICFAGVTGWTAPPILAAIRDAEDLQLVAGVSRSAAGQSLAEATGVEGPGQVHATVGEALRAASVDVLVDYTSATAVKDNTLAAIDADTHVVVGSSGLTADDYASDEKPDVPSGTSRELAETLAHVREPRTTVPVETLHGPVAARGAEVAGTRIHSLRLPSFVVSTEIVFAGPGERLIMRHDPALTPAPYVDGTLLAIRKVADVAGLRRGLDSLLFENPTKH